MRRSSSSPHEIPAGYAGIVLLLDVLQAHGHEGVHAYQIGKDRAPDDELLEIARRESRVIITADLDFPRLMA